MDIILRSQIYLRFKGTWIPIQTLFDGFLALLLMCKVIETIIAVAVVTKFTICKTIAVSRFRNVK